MAPLPPSFDLEAVERTMADLIRAMGLDAATEPELLETPARVAAMYAEIFSGLAPGKLELATFPRPASTGEDLVMVRDIPFYSLCVHHFVPFFGRASIAYLPGSRLIGISGVARVLEHYARRPQLQERLGAQVAEHLQEELEPRGVAVILGARHLCMEMRGIRKPGLVETRTLRGALAEPAWASALPVLGGEPGEPHAP